MGVAAQHAVVGAVSSENRDGSTDRDAEHPAERRNYGIWVSGAQDRQVDGGTRVSIRRSPSVATAPVKLDRSRVGSHDMTPRQELAEELRRLWKVSPAVLQSSPDPDSVSSSRQPCEIELAAHGVGVATGLHARYGKLVKLRVGVLGFPNPRPTRPQAEHSPAGRTAASTRGLRVALPKGKAPPRIRSGFTDTVVVEVSNDSAVDCHLHTNRVLQTAVVDGDGTGVGCFAGMQQMPLKIYTVRPQETVRVPALVGTASLRPELGWAVPPGPWGLIVNLTLGDDLHALRRKRTELWSAPLPLTVDTRG